MQDKITEFLKSHGAGQVGFCRAEENEFGLDYAISYTIPLSDAIVDGIGDAPTHTYFHHYRSVNSLIDHLSLRCGRILLRTAINMFPLRHRNRSTECRVFTRIRWRQSAQVLAQSARAVFLSQPKTVRESDSARY